MKITKSLLEKIIREEVQRTLQESPEPRFLTRMAKDMPVRPVGPPDDPGTLSPDELRAMADELEQGEGSHWETPEGERELSSYTCFQLGEVMRQHEEGEKQLSEKVLSHLSATMQKKGC
tara:strand:- start:1004 stop:1360 length:357 start_codon:yes stop_codon:yes gene_type:complete